MSDINDIPNPPKSPEPLSPPGRERRSAGARPLSPKPKGSRAEVKCLACGRPARRVKPGPSAPVIRWPALCSPECQLAELDRLIGTLRERREKIAAFIAQRQRHA